MVQRTDRRGAAADDLAPTDASCATQRYPTAARRTHHLHLVDEREELERRLYFRDRLRRTDSSHAST